MCEQSCTVSKFPREDTVFMSAAGGLAWLRRLIMPTKSLVSGLHMGAIDRPPSFTPLLVKEEES